MRPAAVVLFAAFAAALSGCSKKPPPAPTPGPDGVETIRGTERLGWDQRAADTAELATFRYAIYVDGTRSEASEVSCGSSAGANGFACSGRLPSLTPGQHTLELAAFIIDGGNTLESARSAPLRVTVTSALAGARAGSLRAGNAGTTSDGVRLRLDVVVQDLDEPSDILFAPDGRLFVAERDGVVRIVDLRSGTQSASTIERDANGDRPVEILALALDRDFERTRHVFAALAERVPEDGGPSRDAFAVVRYREVNGGLGERMVLLRGIPARADRPAAALGIGPDALLYVALDDGGDARTPDDDASLNGKLLRLNRDGTTPGDRPDGTAVHVKGYRSPRAIDWGPGDVLWIADGAPRTPERIIAWPGGISPLDASPSPGASPGPPRSLHSRGPSAPLRSAREAIVVAPDGPNAAVNYALAPNTDPSDAVFYHGEMFAAFCGNLLVAAEGGSHLLRVRLDPRSPTRVTATERLLEGAGPIRAVAVGPDGAIYIATQMAIGRVSIATRNP